MTKKEKMELLLSKVAGEQKADFVTELREATTKEARQELFQKYNIRLSAEEKEALKAATNEVSDEELDVAAGGCCTGCSGDCHCAC
ncbi:MAG: hypothetical protein II845_10270 [Oscillospiraceae bacterium]|nr:hypothetical protein [Oscillospiraceae bacterium]